MTIQRKNVDKELYLGQDIMLDTTGDMKILSDEMTIAQAAQNRCISERGTWLWDDNYGSDLHVYLKENSAFQITDDMVENEVNRALNPMLLDKRIKEIISVKIKSRTTQSIFIEVQLIIGTQNTVISFNINK